MYRIALAMLLLPLPALAQDLPSAVPVVVTVGDATLQRTPDCAFVTASVETRAGTPRDAQRQNAEAMTALQTRLEAARVGKEAIRTLGYDIQQEFDFVQGKRVSRGFFARNSLEVRIDDIAKVGEILDAVVQAGATSVGGVRFDLTDRAGVEREALRMAVTDARARAVAAAGGAGQSIDRVLRIEDAREGPLILPRQTLTIAAAERAPETPIEPGLIEIHARVTFTASLK